MHGRKTLASMLAAATLAFAGCGDDANRVEQATATPAAAKTQAADTPARDLRTIEYEGRDGETALELLRDEGYDVTTESSDLGEYVTAIGDVASTKSEYWTFLVDGKMPNVGADAFETKDGQQVEWRFGS